MMTTLISQTTRKPPVHIHLVRARHVGVRTIDPGKDVAEAETVTAADILQNPYTAVGTVAGRTMTHMIENEQKEVSITEMEIILQTGNLIIKIQEKVTLHILTRTTGTKITMQDATEIKECTIGHRLGPTMTRRIIKAQENEGETLSAQRIECASVIEMRITPRDRRMRHL